MEEQECGTRHSSIIQLRLAIDYGNCHQQPLKSVPQSAVEFATEMGARNEQSFSARDATINPDFALTNALSSGMQTTEGLYFDF